MPEMLMMPKTHEDAVNIVTNIREVATQGGSFRDLSAKQAQEMYAKYAPQINALIGMAPRLKEQNAVLSQLTGRAIESAPGTGSELLTRTGGSAMVGLSIIAVPFSSVTMKDVSDATRLIGETVRDNQELKVNVERASAEYNKARLEIGALQVQLVVAILKDDVKMAEAAGGMLVEKATVLNEKKDALVHSIERLGSHSTEMNNAVSVVKEYLKESGTVIISTAAIAGAIAAVRSGAAVMKELGDIAKATGMADTAANTAGMAATAAKIGQRAAEAGARLRSTVEQSKVLRTAAMAAEHAKDPVKGGYEVMKKEEEMAAKMDGLQKQLETDTAQTGKPKTPKIVDS